MKPACRQESPQTFCHSSKIWGLLISRFIDDLLIGSGSLQVLKLLSLAHVERVIQKEITPNGTPLSRAAVVFPREEIRSEAAHSRSGVLHAGSLDGEGIWVVVIRDFEKAKHRHLV